MSTVLLASLSDHDAAAIEILISMSWRDKRCVLLKRTASFSLPLQNAQAAACAKVVVDLGGMGLHQYSPEHAQTLLAFLAGRSALLLTRKDGGRWPQADLALPAGQRLEFLAAPYSSAAVKAALSALDKPAAVKKPQPPVAAKSAPASPSGAAQQAAPAVALSAALASAAAPSLWELLPALQRKHFLRLVDKLRGSDAQLLHIGAAQLLLQPQEAWVAASMPVSALLKVLGNAEQLESASVERLSAPAAALAQRQLTEGKGQRYMLALDVVLWDLCSHALGSTPLQLQGDAVFRLTRFPNFTQLGQVGALDMQLAAICVRGEQPLRPLLALFPEQEEQVLRFVALATLAGLGQLQAPALVLGATRTGKNSSTRTTARAPTRGHKERRGFLRSLLDKLF